MILLVQYVEFLSRRILLEQLARHLALGSEHNPILCQYTESRPSVRDSFQSILYLVQAPFWGEDRRL